MHPLDPADASTERMHYQGKTSQKAYQAHVSFDRECHMWCSWATYGPADKPRRQSTIIGLHLTPDAALDAAMKRSQAKVKKGYRIPDHLVGSSPSVSGCFDSASVRRLMDKDELVRRGEI
jgi:hypothetical protein